jgi:uncharacterized RDD family membrane protein YckC
MQRAHSHRILGSAIYDGLVILGLLMLAGFIAVYLNKLITGEEAIDHNPLFQIYLLVIIIGYFIYFWKKSGQTVGMKAWRIKLVNLDNTSFTYRQLLLRFVVAIPSFCCFGIGILWQYISSKKLNWQDLASQTRLVYIPKKK